MRDSIPHTNGRESAITSKNNPLTQGCRHTAAAVAHATETEYALLESASAIQISQGRTAQWGNSSTTSNADTSAALTRALAISSTWWESIGTTAAPASQDIPGSTALYPSVLHSATTMELAQPPASAPASGEGWEPTASWTADAEDTEHAILIKLVSVIQDTPSTPPPKSVNSHATVKQALSVKHQTCFPALAVHREHATTAVVSAGLVSPEPTVPSRLRCHT